MQSSTSQMYVNLQILESVFHNCETQIPKIKMAIQFENAEVFKKFSEKMAPISNEENDVITNSDSDDEAKADEPINHEPKESLSEKLSKIEESIVLKQYYKEQIQKISRQTGVRILIVPDKIKYFGPTSAQVTEAKTLIYNIRDSIVINPVCKFGKEVMESKYYRSKLESQKIYLGKVAEKYYSWYDETKADSKIVKSTIESIFEAKTHIFYELSQGYIKQNFNEVYIKSITSLKAKLFSEHLSPQLNDSLSSDLHVELNDEADKLIIHCVVHEQSEMFEKEVEAFYGSFTYFFINFDVEEEDEVEEIESIEKMMSEEGILYHRIGNLLALAFDKKNVINKPDETLSNLNNVFQTQKAKFFEVLKPVFEKNKNFDLQLLQSANDQELNLEELEVPELKKQITKVFKKPERIWIIKPKIRKVNLFIDIIDKYILSPNFSEKKSKADEQSMLIENTVSISQQINQTATQREIQNSYYSNANNPVEPSEAKILPDDILKSKFTLLDWVQQYSIYIPDALGETKYDDKQQQISFSKKCPLNEELQQNILAITNQKFKPVNVRVPMKYKQQLRQRKGEIVTVFAKDSEKEKFYEASFQIYLIQKWKETIGNGWLLNVEKGSITEENNRFLLEGKNFEVIMYLRHIKK